MELKDYIRIVWRRKWTASVVILAVLGMFYAAVSMQTHAYRAATTIKVYEPSRAVRSSRVNLFEGEPWSRTTIIEAMRQKPVMGLAARALIEQGYYQKLDQWRADRKADGATSVPPIFPTGDDAVALVDALHTDDSPLSDEVRRRVDSLAREIRGTVRIGGGGEDEAESGPRRVVPSTSKLTLSAVNAEPPKAVWFVNALALAARTYFADKSTETLRDAIAAAEERRDDLADAHQEAVTALFEWQIENDISDPVSTASDIRQSQNSRERRLEEIDRQINLHVEQITDLSRRLDEGTGGPFGRLPRDIPTSARMNELRQQRLKLELDLARLLETKTPQHPNVRSVMAELDKVRSDLDEATFEAAQQAEARLLDQIDEQRLKIRTLQEEKRSVAATMVEAEARRQQILQLISRYNELKDRADRVAAERSGAVSNLANLRNERDRQVPWVFYDPENRSDGVAIAGTAGTSLDDSWPLAIILAVLAGLGAAYLREYIDTKISTEYDVRRHLNLPVLAIIPDEDKNLLHELSVRHKLAEVYDTSATLIKSSLDEVGMKTMLVCSANPKEGKTTISLNLAVAMARKGLDVVLVDADMRIPRIHDLLGLDNATGLSTILEGGGGDVREIVADIKGESSGSDLEVDRYLRPVPGVPNLKVLPSGPSPENPVPLLESGRMRDLMTKLRETAEYVVVDTPPIRFAGDTLILSRLVDVQLFVVGAGETEQTEVTWAKHLLTNIQASILGVFLNKAGDTGSSTYYYYYYGQHRKRAKRGT